MGKKKAQAATNNQQVVLAVGETTRGTPAAAAKTKKVEVGSGKKRAAIKQPENDAQPAAKKAKSGNKGGRQTKQPAVSKVIRTSSIDFNSPRK
jgi:hypothetical protein